MKQFLLIIMCFVILVEIGIADGEDSDNSQNIYEMIHCSPEEQELVYNIVMQNESRVTDYGGQVVKESIAPYYIFMYPMDENNNIKKEEVENIDYSKRENYKKIYYMMIYYEETGKYMSYCYDIERKEITHRGYPGKAICSYEDCGKTLEYNVINWCCNPTGVIDCFLAFIPRQRVKEGIMVVTNHGYYFLENKLILSYIELIPSVEMSENLFLEWEDEEMIREYTNYAVDQYNNREEILAESKRQWEIDHPGEPYPNGEGGISIGSNSGNTVTSGNIVTNGGVETNNNSDVSFYIFIGSIILVVLFLIFKPIYLKLKSR